MLYWLLRLEPPQVTAPLVGSLNYGVGAPVLSLRLGPASGALSYVGYTPSILQAHPAVAPVAGALRYTGGVPSLPGHGVIVDPATGSLLYTGYRPHVDQTIRVKCAYSSDPLEDRTQCKYSGSDAPTIGGSGGALPNAARRARPSVGGLLYTGGVPTITLPEVPATLTIDPLTYNVYEGSNPSMAPATATYVLTRTDTSEAGTLDWTVSGYGAHPASANDFVGFGGVAYPSGVLTFDVGQPSNSIILTISIDTTPEYNEEFRLDIDNVVLPGISPTLTLTAFGSILNDDGPVYTNVAPSVGAVVFSGGAPSVRVTASSTKLPSAGSLIYIGSPAIVLIFTTRPSRGALAYTGYVPTVARTSANSVAPAVGALQYTGHIPTVASTANRVVVPSVGALSYAGYAPVVNPALSVTWNPSDISSALALSLSNTKVQATTTTGASAGASVRATQAHSSSGVWVYEFKFASVSSGDLNAGLLAGSGSLTAMVFNQAVGFAFGNDGIYGTSGAATGSTTAPTSTDVMAIVWDAAGGTVKLYKNGSFVVTMFTGVTGSYYPAASVYPISGQFSTNYVTANFGTTTFAYNTYPSGSKSWDGSQTF